MRFSDRAMHRERIQLVLDAAIVKLAPSSRMEPHKTFWLCALPCPYCRRHIAAFTAFVTDYDKPPPANMKGRVCALQAGRVISIRKH